MSKLGVKSLGDKSDIIENLLFPSGGTNIDLQLESPGDSTRARASVNQYNDSNASRDTNVCENNKAPSSTRLKGMATGGEDNKSDKLHVNNHFDDSDDIQEIPNLEENTDESVKFIAAPAPNEESLILPTWEELNSQLLFPVFRCETGIDLTPLTRNLVPVEQTKEEDIPWDFELLFKKVSHEVRLAKKTS